MTDPPCQGCCAALGTIEADVAHLRGRVEVLVDTSREAVRVLDDVADFIAEISAQLDRDRLVSP